MKQAIILYILCLLIGSACSNNQVQIKFCEALDDQEICAVGQDTFPPYQRVQFSCHSVKAFQEGEIKGAIYKLSGKEGKQYIGEHIFKVAPNTNTLSYFIPFDMYGGFGDYIVELSGPDGALLAAEQLYIEPQ